jgi:hypothetical protein
MEEELKFSKSQLGLFDSALLLPYALVQVFKKYFLTKHFKLEII